MMRPLLTTIEKPGINTTLGIRFWDPARNAQVRDGLVVTARPERAGHPTSTAVKTVSGVYALQGLAGLNEVEYSYSDLPFTPSPPLSRRFIVKVEDLTSSFLPAVFAISLPLPYKGVFLTGGSSPFFAESPPEAKLPGFYLFSAPTRRAAEGLAVLRGHLIQGKPSPEPTGRTDHNPVANAVVEVLLQNKKWYGISDATGRVAVLFPYPTMNAPLLSPPAGTSYIPLYQQHWSALAAVYSCPELLEYPAESELPYLDSILKQLKPEHKRQVWLAAAGPSLNEWPVDITFNREQILCTETFSELYVDMGTSPP